MSLIETLQNLEPIFIQAGQLAYKMQAGVKHHKKLSTGDDVIDIVTEADLVVQEFLLKEISKTELIDCRLLAEEDTPCAKIFNEQGNNYLALDPIDGTAVYAKGGKHFSIIVSLHDGKKPLYTFVHYPALGCTYKIVNNKLSIIGEMPFFHLPPKAQQSIVYYHGNPDKVMAELYGEFKNKDIDFVEMETISQDVGTIESFAGNRVIGVYKEDINVYDGLVEFHLALAKNLKIYSGGPNGDLDLSNIKKRDYGFYYPGYYLALSSLYK